MDFFKSVFSDGPTPLAAKPDSTSTESVSSHEQSDPSPDPDPGIWSFSSLVKTLSIKSESVIETYRRDLKEFGSGLRKEIEVAQGSIGTVSHAIDEFGSSVLKETAQIISKGKEVILADDDESDSFSDSSNKKYSDQRSLNSKSYSRFEAQIHALQGDGNTFCEEPEDLEDYNRWRLGFVVEERKEEIDGLLQENEDLESIYHRVVPGTVDESTFWCRYFYKVFKLKQAEDLRANLVKRAISREDEEELSWDVDDEEEEEEDGDNAAPPASRNKEGSLERKDSDKTAKEEKASVDSKKSAEKNSGVIVEDDSSVGETEAQRCGAFEETEEKQNEVKGDVESIGDGGCNSEVIMEKNDGVHKEVSVSHSDEKVVDEGKVGHLETRNVSSKEGDLSDASNTSKPSLVEDEDLGWDEIEDLTGIEDKKVTHDVGVDPSLNRADLRERLSFPEEEDLSWDIEDDDEPVKHAK